MVLDSNPTSEEFSGFSTPLPPRIAAQKYTIPGDAPENDVEIGGYAYAPEELDKLSDSEIEELFQKCRSVYKEKRRLKMSSTPYQPNFQTEIQGGIPASEFDDLSPLELDKLLNAVTGRGQLRSSPPPPAKRVVSLDHILGGLHG